MDCAVAMETRSPVACRERRGFWIANGSPVTMSWLGVGQATVLPSSIAVAGLPGRRSNIG